MNRSTKVKHVAIVKKWIRLLLVVLGCVLLALGFLAALPQKEQVDDTPPEPLIGSPYSTRHREELGRGLRIRSGDLYAPILTAGSARIEKRRLGPLVLPAFNVLVFEEVELIFSIHDQQAFSLPEEIEVLISADPEKPVEPRFWTGHEVDPGDEAQPPRSMRQEPLLSSAHEEFLRTLLADRKISGLRIRSLRLSVSDGEDKRNFLQAARADGHPDGTLRLRNCRFTDPHGTERFAENAVLHPNEPVMLVVGNEHILIREVIDTFR